MTQRRHFLVLDALRGVAALGVLVFHTSYGLPSGILAVDLFFMLSGFVIAFSYEDQLLHGLSVSEFALRRFVRLYPMILLGSIAGLLAFLIHNATQSPGYPAAKIIRAFAFSLALIPSFGQSAFGDEIFPLNTVIWSLFFDIVANAIYVLFAKHLRTPVLIVLVVLSLAAIVGRVIFEDNLGGNLTTNFWGGLERVDFGFFSGVLLYRLFSSGRLPRIGFGAFPLSVALLLIFALPSHTGKMFYVPIALAFAVIITLGAHATPARFEAKTSMLLGALSYPIYLLHRPLLFLFEGFAVKAGVFSEHKYFPVLLAVMMFQIVAVSYVVLKVYDEPLRAALSRRLTPSRLIRQSP